MKELVMLCHVKDLSPEQLKTFETLLGRQVAPDESLSIKSVGPSAIATLQPLPGDRAEALGGLEKYFAKVDSRRTCVGEVEEVEIVNEALRSTRPGYGSVR